MTRVVLLEEMKAFTVETVKDLLLPVPPPHVEDEEEPGDLLDEEIEAEEDEGAEDEDTEDEPDVEPPPPPPRAASVFRTALPERNSAISEAPYVLHQVIKSRDVQPPGELPHSEIVLRTVFCVYHENREEGGLALLNLMERLRIAILRKRVIGRQFHSRPGRRPGYAGVFQYGPAALRHGSLLFGRNDHDMEMSNYQRRGALWQRRTQQH